MNEITKAIPYLLITSFFIGISAFMSDKSFEKGVLIGQQRNIDKCNDSKYQIGYDLGVEKEHKICMSEKYDLRMEFDNKYKKLCK